MSGSMFKRRDGTAGISGHLYETKLLSLLYFRAFHDDTIEEFQLASNVDNIGAFDDICFRATVKKHDNPICLFIQAKHRENKKKILKIDLSTYFISYLKIQEHFDPSNKDLFFGCKFDETECYFVIYTTARDEFSNDSNIKRSSLCSNLHDLINTGGKAKPFNVGEDTEFLCEIAIKEHMASLAKRITKYVMGEMKFQTMLTTELMMCYHVILGQKVVDVSDIHPEGHRIATFRQDFFNTNNKYLTVFKDTLYREIVKTRIIDPTDNIKSFLSEFLAKTTDAEKLSKLIGPVIKYNNDGVLQINKQYTEYIGPQQLNEVKVSPETVKQAVELAAKEILLSPKLDLKVPAAFGNKDLTVKKPTRIDHLVSVITDLLDKCKYSKTVIIDESLEDGFLKLKGGISGAIGNIFVLDDDPKLMKVTSDENSLGKFAKSLYQRLNDKIKLTNDTRMDNNKIPDLYEYKFCFKFKKCPKLLLESSEYEKNLARDFLDKLLIYSGQADEKDVEDKLKDEIEERLDHNDYLQAKTEPMFLKYHDEMQKWWMLQKEAPYLNRNNRILKEDASNIAGDPLMSDISHKHITKIQQYNYLFTENAVRSLNLQDQHSSTIIVAENSVLTVCKVLQHLILQNKEHVVLDFECIVNLPRKKRNALRRELTNTEKVLILVCNNIPKNEKITFKNVAEAVRNKVTIIITIRSYKEILQKYFGTADDRIVHDDRNSLNDMREESQRNILASGKVKFQGMEVELEPFLNDWTPVPDDANLGRIL